MVIFLISEEVRHRRGCSVVRLSQIGNCTNEKVSYGDGIVDGKTCFCHDEALCNTSTQSRLFLPLLLSLLIL